MWTHLVAAILVSSTLAMSDADKEGEEPIVEQPKETKVIYKKSETFREEDFLGAELQGEIKGPRIITIDSWTPSDWQPMIAEREHFLGELVEAFDKL